MDDISKNRTGLIRSIIVLTICIISCTVFLVNHKQEVKLSTREQDNTTEIIDSTPVNAIESTDSIRKTISLESVNDMFRTSSKAFTDIDNLKTINISSVTLLGYLSNNPSEKLGKIEGTFSCLDGTTTCLYTEDIYEIDNTTYGFSIYTIFTLNSNYDYYISMMNDSSMLTNPLYTEDYLVIE